MLKLVTWNIAQREDAWRYLVDTDADIALLQEAAEPPAEIVGTVKINPGPWRTVGACVDRPWRAAIVNLTNRAEVEWIHPTKIGIKASHAAPTSNSL